MIGQQTFRLIICNSPLRAFDSATICCIRRILSCDSASCCSVWLHFASFSAMVCFNAATIPIVRLEGLEALCSDSIDGNDEACCNLRADTECDRRRILRDGCFTKNPSFGGCDSYSSFSRDVNHFSIANATPAPHAASRKILSAYFKLNGCAKNNIAALRYDS